MRCTAVAWAAAWSMRRWRIAGHLDLQVVYLNTLAGLDAARALYERAGFRLVREIDAQTWGRAMHEQRFEWTAPPRESRS